jgi:hypothetical protein
LLIRICTIAEQEIGAVGVAQGDGVEEGRAPVVVGDVDFGVTKADLESISPNRSFDGYFKNLDYFNY